MRAEQFALAIDAGGTFFKSAIVSSEGHIVKGSHGETAVNSDGGKEILFTYQTIISKALNFASKNNIIIEGVGVSTPGPFDYNNATSLMKHKFKDIYGINLREEIKKSLPLTDKFKIKFLQDSHAFLLGEFTHGAAVGFQNVAVVVIGTGLGFGIIKNGRLLDNGKGGPYISIYGLPWEDGILEDVVSKRGIINLYYKMANVNADQSIDVIDIARLAQSNNDKDATNVFGEVGRVLAVNLHGILSEMEIECLVLGGQISKSFALIENDLREGLCDIKSLKKIAMGNHINTSALIGAASIIF